MGVVKSSKAPIKPLESARQAGLRYVSDDGPGIRRKTKCGHFVYIFPGGKPVGSRNELNRIRGLAIPPAWTDVWICQSQEGHLQATGRDARNRKQYRYHSSWRRVRDATKYDRMIAFGIDLPKIRRRVRRDLRLKGLPREKVIATVVRLLETSLIRIGNDEYARENKSFGLTTMRVRHARVSGSSATFRFRGKSGKHHLISVDDPALAKIVKRCQELPGYELFQYVDERDHPQKIDSTDVNQYLREITNQDFSAKDFRTWAGTVLASIALRKLEQPTSLHQGKQNVAKAITAVATMLGNTPTICRKSYVHPAIISAYLDGSLFQIPLAASASSKLRSGEEVVALKVLRRANRSTLRQGQRQS